MGEYTIRQAVSEDADAVTAMWLEMAAQHSAYDDVRWGWRDDAATSWRAHFIDSLAKADSIILVAADSAGRPVGYLMGSTGATVPSMVVRCRGEVSDMFVRPEMRRHGLGQKLLAAASETMKARGAEYVTLFVACANDRAVAFYESMGMRPVCHQMYKRL